MTDDAGNMSIDFLIGFTIFILAFVWVATLIPGIMIGLQSNAIDFDAVAYRTGVILVEDPGWPVSPGWESYDNLQKANITRFGLAISKDTPNILSQNKVDRFFCLSSTDPAVGFVYPDEYQQRAIFGDRPYRFNISLLDIERDEILSVGEIRPDGYGYIRRLVKIKGTSNASIGSSYITANNYINKDNVTTHKFSILVNRTNLVGDNAKIKDPIYQINPEQEQIMINITNITGLQPIKCDPPVGTVTISLVDIILYGYDGITVSRFANVNNASIDNIQYGADITGNYTSALPVQDSVSLKFTPPFFENMATNRFSQFFITLTFDLNSNKCTFLNNTAMNPLDYKSTFLNNQYTKPFDYDYNPANVTQPRLRDAVVEVAVW